MVSYQNHRANLVDLKGFEPSTPTMRMWCAPNCATSPYGKIISPRKGLSRTFPFEKPEFTELRFLFSFEQPFDASVVCGNISQIVTDRRACHRKDNGHDPFPQAIYLIAILEYIGND